MALLEEFERCRKCHIRIRVPSGQAGLYPMGCSNALQPVQKSLSLFSKGWPSFTVTSVSGGREICPRANFVASLCLW